ncbi:hypothetical protein vBAcoSR7M_10 [Alteromonas phage vB_AcoS-R7M]|uniref:Uncharacterized protein n=1 Tax=Alteromonas phage vB_AcoS-R7M TaxID=2729541 RepID=A0A6M3YN55_9CAUD|nr:hypothetical protein HWD34_gp10 [Alteromonas phage vB_AcoS-R7M]QJI53332.1 hypothetical protein vBAcoSR7M_10 [Alteromonas phage vB_AcoS-R7M]
MRRLYEREVSALAHNFIEQAFANKGLTLYTRQAMDTANPENNVTVDMVDKQTCELTEDFICQLNKLMESSYSIGKSEGERGLRNDLRKLLNG